MVADIATKTVSSVAGFSVPPWTARPKVHRPAILLIAGGNPHLKAGRTHAFFNVALGAIHEGLHFIRIETYFGWAIRRQFLNRHGLTLFAAMEFQVAVIIHHSTSGKQKTADCARRLPRCGRTSGGQVDAMERRLSESSAPETCVFFTAYDNN